MRNDIIKTIRYFSFFQYAPTLGEIWKLLPRKATLTALKKEIKDAIGKNLILEHKINPNLKNKQEIYTIEEYGIKQIQNSMDSITLTIDPERKSNGSKFKIRSLIKRKNLSERKLKKIESYVKILEKFTQIKLIGISGSVAMMNAEKKDDIDLFIITAKNRLWTARFIAVFLAHILGLRRRRNIKRAPDKVCLNLFFEETNTGIPDFKKNEYVAHEILQMKPLVNKDGAYERFLLENRWVFEMFPNSISVMPNLFQHLNNKKKILKRTQNGVFIKICNLIEQILKDFQLISIRKHQTTEIVTDTQLWFFPDDFEKKIKGKLI